ncbi:MAG: D-Ala-D-Ala carboxypeptidase family metallohydrolase [Pontixanthobacter sp.]
MKRTFIAALIGLVLLGGALWLIGWRGNEPLTGNESIAPYSREAFEEWLIADPARQSDFEGLVHLLASKGVGNVVPIWQLARTDNNLAKDCTRPEFLIPPRENWDRIVPVLALLRDEIKPQIGEVEVESSYRTQDFNACIGGASESKHLDFAALDLIAVTPTANPDLFGKLCAIHKQLGPASKFGLGAYFNSAKPAQASGRFHVDVSGYRSWGYSKSADSSGCLVF